MNRRVYCEYLFLKHFVTDIPKHDNLPQNRDPYTSWRKMFEFLMRSQIIVDITRQQLLDECLKNDVLFNLYRSNPNFKCLGSKFPSISKLDKSNIDKHKRFFSVYLTNSNKRIREEISSKLGLIILGKSDINKFEEMFEEFTFPIPKGISFSWENIPLNEMIRKSNSMIIVDNYILDDTKLLEKNFKSLMEKLLPERSSVEYHITVIAKLKGTLKSKNEEDAKFRYNKCRQILEDVSKKKNNLQLSCSVVHSNDFHDRIIVTNNVWIDCGAGFELVNCKGKTSKRTNLRFSYPFMTEGHQEWVDDAFFFLLSDCIKEKDYIDCNIPQNRLIKLVE